MKVVIFLPAYNESKVIGSVLEELPKELPGVDEIITLVVDDGSDDNTGKIAKEHGALVLRHVMNRGVGIAKRTGLAAAQKLGADILITMDSDGQHDTKDIPAVLAPVLEEKADIVVGSRLINSKDMPWIRRVGNKSMNLFLRVFIGLSTTDSQSGFRAYSKKALESLKLKTSGYEVDTEILMLAQRAKLRVVDVPIKVIYTAYSKKKGQTLTNSVNIVVRLLLKAISG